MAARKTLRRAVQLPAAAYAAITYLAETLDWLHPCHQDQWHQEAANDMGEDIQHAEHLSLHL